MKPKPIVCVLAVWAFGIVLTLPACSREPGEAAGAKPTQQEVQARDAAALELMKPAADVMQYLSGLDDDQRQAVAGLIVMSNIAQAYDALQYRTNARLAAESLDAPLRGLTRLPAGAPMREMPCRAESIAYAQAMASCQKDGRDEEECPAAWGAASAEMACMMKWLAVQKELLTKVFVGRFPPVPPPPVR
jgi:hypothetical protein